MNIRSVDGECRTASSGSNGRTVEESNYSTAQHIHVWTHFATIPDVSDQSQAGNVIRSNGLSINRYNELSHVLGKSKDLRERVQHQAYLYRVNADLRGDKPNPFVEDPSSTSFKGERQSKGQHQVLLIFISNFRLDFVDFVEKRNVARSECSCSE